VIVKSPVSKWKNSQVVNDMTTDNHPTDQQLSAYHDGELPSDQRSALSAHLAWCQDCLKRIGQLTQMSSMFASSSPSGISQIALRRLHAKLDEVIERGLVRWAWEVSGIAAAILIVGSILLARMADPSTARASSAGASVPPWVATQASADPVVSDAATPAAVWYLADARNSSEVSP
jgi:anti-sigma factor RsiW